MRHWKTKATLLGVNAILVVGALGGGILNIKFGKYGFSF
jgi:hypothetical protein